MEILKNLVNLFAPSTVSCNQQFDTELPHDHVAQDEDFSPVHKGQRRKVPGFEHLLNPILTITGEMEFIKGFKFDVTLPLSEYFQSFLTWQLPNSGVKEEGHALMMPGRGHSKPTFSFMSQVVQEIRSPQEPPGIVMMGKVDSQGKSDSVFMKRLGDNLNLRLSGNFHSSKLEDGALAADLEYEDQDSVAIARLSHSIQGVMGGFNYMQRINRNLMLGFDYTNLFTHKRSMFSYGIKAFLGNHSLYGSYLHGGQQIHFGYTIPVRKGTTFVSHYKQDPESGSSAILGVRQRFEDAEITANLSSQGKLMSIVSIKAGFWGIKLCAEIDYVKDHYSCGYGISLGPQQ